MKKLLLLLACLMLTGPASNADTPHYNLTVLPVVLNGDDPLNRLETGGGLNGRGQVVGTRKVRSGQYTDYRTALWQKGHAVKMLDNTPAVYNGDSSNRTTVFPAAINDRGDVVGGSYYEFSGAYSGTGCAPLLWRGGKTITLAGFPEPTAQVALGISDTGLIIGNYVYDDDSASASADPPPPPSIAGSHAYLLRGGRVKTLWPGVARAVDNRGEVAGIWEDNDSDQWRDRGVFWRGGHVTFLKMQPIAINGRGWIAGSAYATELKSRAYLWKGGRLVPLTRQLSKAYALNLRGDVVGEQDDPASSHSPRATLWRRGRTYDLNRCVVRSRGWVLESAAGINDRGWIIGTGSVYKSPNDKTPVREFTFLLTPL